MAEHVLGSELGVQRAGAGERLLACFPRGSRRTLDTDLVRSAVRAASDPEDVAGASRRGQLVAVVLERECNRWDLYFDHGTTLRHPRRLG
jgi:hypothetical protein